MKFHFCCASLAVVNGNTTRSTANSKASPESTCSWSEDRCNGHDPGRFSSPASGLSGFSSSVMSATSESALSTQSGYSSGRDGNTQTETNTHKKHMAHLTPAPDDYLAVFMFQPSALQTLSSVLLILVMPTNLKWRLLIWEMHAGWWDIFIMSSLSTLWYEDIPSRVILFSLSSSTNTSQRTFRLDSTERWRFWLEQNMDLLQTSGALPAWYTHTHGSSNWVTNQCVLE